TSWGVSTRMIGGLVMTHSDDNGLVCPSRLAPVQVAIVPIWKSEEERDQVSGVGDQVKTELEKAGFRVELDLRDNVKPGAKYFEWEAKGVPLRLEIGPRDVAGGQVMTARRTGGKAPAPLDGLTRCGRRRTRLRPRVAARNRGARGHACLRLQRESHAGAVPRAARRLEGRAAPHLLFREGKRQCRRAQGAQGPRRWRRHRFGRR